MFKEFKKFAMRGNIMDLAVGVVIGGAFQTIVNSLVQDIIMPAIAMITGKVDFSNLVFTVGDTSIRYGNFITAIVNFLIIAFSIFLFVTYLNKLNKKLEKMKIEEIEKITSKIDKQGKMWKKRNKKEEKEMPTEKTCPYCFSTINIKASRCPFCTSVLENKKELDEKQENTQEIKQEENE